MKASWAYLIFKAYVRFGLKVFFKKWQSNDRDRIPKDGPFIFVANHQNAFLDALIVVCGIKRHPWFLARGDVFKKPRAVRLLTFLRIKPVYRFRDGISAMRNNEKIIQECVDLLKQGECVLLFGEGNHNEPWTMRDLQKGFAQIAFQYMDQTGKDIPIVPVGIHYEHHHIFRSRVLVRYGHAFSVNEVVGTEAQGRHRFAPLLTFTAEKIRDLILTVPLDDDYTERKNYLIRNRKPQHDMMAQLEADRQMMQQWKPGTPDIKPKRGFNPSFLNPLYWYGKLLHLIPEQIIRWATEKKIKDNQFVGSIKVALGIFLIPAYYLLLALIILLITCQPWWTLAFMGSLPISGYFAYNWD